MEGYIILLQNNQSQTMGDPIYIFQDLFMQYIYPVTFAYSMMFEYYVTDRWIQNPPNISTNRKACYMKN
jgi:hypothetical protein